MNEKEICDLYSDSSRSLESVAKQAKTSVYLVRRCLDKNGIEIRPSGRPRVGITDPKALVHLGVKITKSDRDALETGAGKSANVREAISLWKDRNKAAHSLQAGIDYPGVAVAFLIVHPESEKHWSPINSLEHRFLFSKRGPASRNEVGKWEFGGGGLRVRETIYEAVVREVKEEYGLEVHSMSDSTLVEQFIEGQHWLCNCVFAFVKNADIKVSEPDKIISPTWEYGYKAFKRWDMSQAAINAWEALQ